jgi:DNA (cytosine-5)-methyltransferase 1
MLEEFARLVTEAAPEWFLLENVPTVPDLEIEGYKIQRFDLNANECGLNQNRLRHFQFGSKTGKPLYIERQNRINETEPCCMASEGRKGGRRKFADFCELQGLPRDFRLSMLSIAQNYKVVGNGVALPMARLIAKSINAWTVTFSKPDRQEINSDGQSHFLVDESQNFNRAVTLCRCGCGRGVTGRQKSALPACRKRIERKNKKRTASHISN